MKNMEIIKKLDKNTIKRIANELMAGKIAVFPTDTIYGLGTNAFKYESVKRIYKLKGRDYRKPLPVLVENILQVKKLVKNFDKHVESLARQYWPGALTLVFETSELGNILMGGKKSIAVRIPNNENVLSIIREMKCPLVGTSANISGTKGSRNVKNIDKKLLKNVDIVIDGGEIESKSVSTVLDISRFHYVVLREGAISRQELKRFLKIN